VRTTGWRYRTPRAIAGTAAGVLTFVVGYRGLTPAEGPGVDATRSERPARGAPAETWRVEGSLDAPAFPETNPVAVDGAAPVYYLAENPVQAGLYGLPATHARSWGLHLDPGVDVDERRDRLRDAVRRSGATVARDLLDQPGSDFATLTAEYRGWRMLVTVHLWQALTVTLVAD